MNPVETEISQSPFGPEETFATHYCRSHGVASARYVDTLLRESLYPHARVLRFILPARLFAADRTFLINVGRIRRRREFNNLMLDFTESYENHTWWRDVLHLRISMKRLQAIVWKVFAQACEGKPAAPSP